MTAAAAERAAVEEPAGLGTGGDRLLARAGRPTGPSPVDRARPGSKHHLVVDGQSIPLAVSLTGGNHNDVTQLEPLLDKIPAVAGQIGRPRRGPDALLADRGYDHDEYPRLLWQRGIRPVIAKRGRATRHWPGHLPPHRRAHDRLAPRLPPPRHPLGTTRRHSRSIPRPRRLPDHPPPRPTSLFGPLREHDARVVEQLAEKQVPEHAQGRSGPRAGPGGP
ncbi:transposase [Streptomyces sp. DHE17-7]|nr:transposase [Streptomyces sp. DHE17-7]